MKVSSIIIEFAIYRDAREEKRKRNISPKGHTIGGTLSSCIAFARRQKYLALAEWFQFNRRSPGRPSSAIYTVSNTSSDVYIYTPHGRGGDANRVHRFPREDIRCGNAPFSPLAELSLSLSLPLSLTHPLTCSFSLSFSLEPSTLPLSSSTPPTSPFFHSAGTARPQWVDQQSYSCRKFYAASNTTTGLFVKEGTMRLTGLRFMPVHP